MSLTALPAAAGSAILFGFTSALQHRAAHRAPRRPALHPGLLGHLLRDPAWLLGGICELGAIVLQAIALRNAPVSLVQPVLVLGLPCAVLLSFLFARQTPRWREVITCSVCALAVAALVVLTQPSGGTAPTSLIRWLPTVTGAVGVSLLLLLPAGRHRPVLTATCAGVNLALASILLRLLWSTYRQGSTAQLFAAAAALLVTGAISLLACQSAFQNRTLAGPLAALTVAEPLVAAAGGILLLHEQIQAGNRLPAICLAGLTTLATMTLLAYTPLPRGQSPEESGTEADGRRRRPPPRPDNRRSG